GAGVALSVLTAPPAWGQPARTNVPPSVYREKVEPHWFAGTDGVTNQFWYRVETGRNRHEFVLVKAKEGTRGAAFDHAKAAESLAKLTGEAVEAERLPVRSLEYAPDGKTLLLKGVGTNWNLDLESYAVTAQKSEGGEEHRLSATRQPRPSR